MNDLLKGCSRLSSEVTAPFEILYLHILIVFKCKLVSYKVGMLLS